MNSFIRNIPLVLAFAMIVFYINLSLKDREMINTIDNSLEEDNNFFTFIISPFFYRVTSSKFISKRIIKSNLYIQIKYLYEDEYIKYYLFYILSIKIGLIYFTTIAILTLLALEFNIFVLALGLTILIFIPQMINKNIENRVDRKISEIHGDLPTLLTKLSLLIKAGLNFRDSIRIVSYSSEGFLYEELRNTIKTIDNGASEEDSYNKLAGITDTIIMRKFTSAIIQNLSKGSEGFDKNLDLIKEESWELKKNNIIIMSKIAGQKLLIPNTLMFMGVMIMVMMPIIFNAL